MPCFFHPFAGLPPRRTSSARLACPPLAEACTCWSTHPPQAPFRVVSMNSRAAGPRRALPLPALPVRPPATTHGSSAMARPYRATRPGSHCAAAARQVGCSAEPFPSPAAAGVGAFALLLGCCALQPCHAVHAAAIPVACCAWLALLWSAPATAVPGCCIAKYLKCLSLFCPPVQACKSGCCGAAADPEAAAAPPPQPPAASPLPANHHTAAGGVPAPAKPSVGGASEPPVSRPALPGSTCPAPVRQCSR